ncbi:MAG: 5-formyltetrahydrofolate cyclo-ligase [Halolamina sp.]
MDKQAIRETVWDDLEESGVARFPFPPHGRIPNFDGADEATARLRETTAWREADVVKANPDAPQLPVRRAALRDGKLLYMARPRLRYEEPFLELDPATVDDVDEATTVSGCERHGEPVGPSAVPDVDLVVAGSVAVTGDGRRIGKGEGFSDLEFAVLSDLDAVGEATTTATTVHERQVVDAAPTDAHDVPQDLVVTPERTVTPDAADRRPTGVDWDAVPAETVSEIPVLQRLQPE